MRSFLLMAALGFGMVVALGCGQDKPAGNVEVLEPSDPGISSPGGPAQTPREQVDNPQYASWAHFPKGTSVIHKSVTETDGNPSVTTSTTTCTLIDRTDESAIFEMQTFTRRYDGVETKNPPQKFTNPRLLTLPPGMRKEEFGNPRAATETSEETLTLGGKQYQTKWQKGRDRNEAGEVFFQTWTSAEIPGGLVKSIMTTPAIGTTTTMELVEVKGP